MRTDIGWNLRVDPQAGEYAISTKNPDWTIAGNIGTALRDVRETDGSDRLGAFRSIEFKWRHEGERIGSIRIYQSRPVAIFNVKFVDAVEGSPAAFPILNRLPENLLEFRYGEIEHIRPVAFQLHIDDANWQYGGPFALFDESANTMVLSPAGNFMVAMLSGDVRSSLASGLNRTLKSVPAGYTHETILTVDRGINQTWQTWGNALTDLHGKKRPANDADESLNKISYWTDNGAAYYYNYELEKGYAATLLEVKRHLDELNIPIGSMQFDSWWYPKSFQSIKANDSDKPRSKDPRVPAGTWNRYGGLLDYTAHPDLFPGGLADFQRQLGVPLITHNRWIDPNSAYHSAYKISGVAPVDAKWWAKIIADIATAGVKTYEQDWLNHIYHRSPELSDTTSAGDAFMDGMASACAARGLTMQYCMILPRHLLQGGAKYSNLTTARVSGDRLTRGKWREFFYGSIFSSSLGVWPWTDVFRSRETPNLLISVLSAGVVGLADRIGEEDAANIHRCIRRDGVIVKPDAAIVPTDETIIAQAKGVTAPFVCATYTNHDSAGDAGRASYLFAFLPEQEAATQSWSIDPKSLGIVGESFAYDYLKNTGRKISAGDVVDATLGDDGWSYVVVTPLGKSGMSLIGDTGLFVTRGKKRLAGIHDESEQLCATLLVAPGERSITLAAYAPQKPTVGVASGTCREISYDETGIARITIEPDASADNGADVRQVEVTLRMK